MTVEQQIALPLGYMEQWIESWNYVKIKNYLTLLFRVHEEGNCGWRLEELGNLLKHQTHVLKEKVGYWVEEGWISQTVENEVTLYYLTPLQSEAFMVPLQDLKNLKDQAKQIDLVRWLWLLKFPTTNISQRELLRAFELENQNRLYQTLRELKNLKALDFYRITIDDILYYELDYQPGVIQEDVLIVEAFHSKNREVSEEFFVPKQLITWMREAQGFMSIQIYCLWLWKLREIPNLAMTLNELTLNVLPVRHYDVLQVHFQELRQLQMVSIDPLDNRRQLLVLPEGEWVGFQAEFFEKALKTLKCKEFCLWLSLQLEPTTQLETNEIKDRIRCKNAAQARNIVKRLSDSGFVETTLTENRIREVRYLRGRQTLQTKRVLDQA